MTQCAQMVPTQARFRLVTLILGWRQRLLLSRLSDSNRHSLEYESLYGIRCSRQPCHLL